MDTTEKLFETLNNFEIRELIKPKTTNFLLTCTLRIGTVNKKTCMVFENIEAYNAHIDQIQLKYDGDDEVFTGYLIKFYDPPFEKISRESLVKDTIVFKKLKDMKEKNSSIPTKNYFAKCVRVWTRKKMLFWIF